MITVVAKLSDYYVTTIYYAVAQQCKSQMYVSQVIVSKSIA